MANDKRFIVKNGLGGPSVRFSNTSNSTAVMDFNYGSDGTLRIVGNTSLGTLVTIIDSATPTSNGVLIVNGSIGFGASGVTINSTFFEATANNSLFFNGKQEAQLSVNNAVFANASIYLNGKQESQLSVANAVFATTANNTNYLSGYSWTSPPAIGDTIANTGAFSTLYANTLVINNQLNLSSGLVEMAVNYGGSTGANTTFYAGNNSGTVYAKIGSFGLTVSSGFISGNGAGLTGTGSTFTANNSTYAYGKQESQLSVANAVFAQTANNAFRFNGKQESQLSVANAVFAQTANNSTYLNGKQEAQLSVANAVFAQTANNATYAYGKQEAQLSVANAVYATTAGSVTGNNITGTVANANNAAYLGGFLPSYYTNASNITTGTLPEAQLPYRMNQNLRTTDNATFANLTITGSVVVVGNVSTWAANNLNITDNMIYLNSNSTYTNPDLGIAAAYNDGVYRHTGIFRDSSDGRWKVFDSYLPEPADSQFIDTANSSFRIADFQANVVTIASANVNGTLLTSTSYGGTANNSTYSYGKQESQLSVANAVFAQTANNSSRFNGKQESQLSVANAVFAQTANNTTYAFGKQESQLTVALAANATFSTSANNSTYLNGKQESQLSVSLANNATFAYGKQESQLIVAFAANATFSTSANNSLFAYGKQESQLSVASATTATTANNSTYAYGKQESQLSVATAVNANNSTYLGTYTWATPGALGGTTANSATFTSLTTSGITTHNANTIINGALIANNSAGVAGQILASNGTNVYWISSNNISGTVSTANNALYVNGKQEGQLSVANAVFAQTANNALFAYGKQESQLSVANSAALQGATWQSPLPIGSVTPSTANFTVANTTNYFSVKNIAHLSADSNTTSSIAQIQIGSFSANTYGSAKIYVQATEATTNVRHVTELLVVHNNVTASATEYGMLFTGGSALATYEVDILGNNVRVLATPASANSISFRVSEQLFLQ